jgi:hypothetical protein
VTGSAVLPPGPLPTFLPSEFGRSLAALIAMNDHKTGKSLREGVNRHGAASILLAILGVFATVMDIVAYAKIDERRFLAMDSVTEHRMAVIAFVHPHWWIAVSYFAAFLAGLLWLEIRCAPRWCVWSSFALFSVPCVAYTWGCMGVWNKVFILP